MHINWWYILGGTLAALLVVAIIIKVIIDRQLAQMARGGCFNQIVAIGVGTVIYMLAAALILIFLGFVVTGMLVGAAFTIPSALDGTAAWNLIPYGGLLGIIVFLFRNRLKRVFSSR